MRKLLIAATLISFQFIFSQTFIPAYQTRVNSTTQSNINNYLTEFASYGVKTTGTTNNANALAWLKTKYASFGYTSSQIVEDPFTFASTSSKNLIVTKTGTVYPNTFVIICGHFDTIAGPGVNDNGSGVSTILEIARILQNVPTEYSIKFINFSGEEQGLLGSEHYVDNVANATNPKMDIKVVFNIDQVGGVAGQINNTIRCDVDYYAPSFNNAASQIMANQLAQCVSLYSTLQTSFFGAFGSDYVPFHQDGYVVTGFYEFNESTKEHTPNDTYANMDPVFVFNVAKAAVGAAQHFAVASTTILATDEIANTFDNEIGIFPNPAKDFFEINFNNKKFKNFNVEITDMSGRLIMTRKNTTKINTSDLENGNYLVKISTEKESTTKKLIVAK